MSERKEQNPKSLANLARGFQPGQSGNPAGRPLGMKTKLNEAKLAFYRNTGMMPIDFLVAAMRDELYDGYEIVAGGPFRALGFKPKAGAKKLTVKLDMRLQAARDAAPYFHRKQPIAIQSADGKPLFNFDLTALSTKDLQLALGLIRELRAMFNPEENQDGALLEHDDEGEGERG